MLISNSTINYKIKHGIALSPYELGYIAGTVESKGVSTKRVKARAVKRSKYLTYKGNDVFEYSDLD